MDENNEEELHLCYLLQQVLLRICTYTETVMKVSTHSYKMANMKPPHVR